MKDDVRDSEARKRERRSFLRGALRSTTSVLTAATAAPANAAGEPAAPASPAPPPEAVHVPPEEARRKLDRHQDEFARDNPGQSRYSPD